MPFVSIAAQQIYYAEMGAHGIPIVFVHGAAGNHLVWGMQLYALGTMARALALDLPGHGRSDPPGRTTIDGYGDVILGLLDALNIERAVIVGHSMGGAIAQTLALAHPDRVAGLGLIGTGARLRVLDAILDGVLNEFVKTAELVIENSYSAALDPAMRARAIAEFLTCPAPITHGDFVACNGFDAMARLGDIHAPTAIVCGTEDQMAPHKYSQFLASKIPNARLTLIDHAGHSVMIEQAEQVNTALKNFISTL